MLFSKLLYPQPRMVSENKESQKMVNFILNWQAFFLALFYLTATILFVISQKKKVWALIFCATLWFGFKPETDLLRQLVLIIAGGSASYIIVSSIHKKRSFRKSTSILEPYKKQ